MYQMEGISSRSISVFDGNDYSLWSNIMETIFKSLGVDACLSIVNRYKTPKNPPTNPNEMKLFGSNSKSPHAIISGFSRTIKT